MLLVVEFAQIDRGTHDSDREKPVTALPSRAAMPNPAALLSLLPFEKAQL
jgi:hypothetical protein